jgi:predicted dienelactone hydrolase
VAKVEIVVTFDTEKNEVATRWTNAPKGLIINSLATAIQSVVNQPEAPVVLVPPGMAPHVKTNGAPH